MEAAQGRAYAAGMRLYFDTVNRVGGANGHKFTLISKDDGGRAEDTVAITKQLLAESRPLVLAGYFGNKNITSLVATGLLERERIALVGYRVTEIRPETAMLYGVRATLRDELDKLAEHLATIGITRIGLFLEAGPGAPTLIAAAHGSVTKVNAELVAQAAYPAGTDSVTAAVEAFRKRPLQAIIMVASGAATASFIEKYRARGGAAQLFAHSGADIEQLLKRLAEEQMQGVAIAQVTPSPYRVSSRLAKEFSDAVAKSSGMDVPVSYVMMEGYIAARIIVEAVRREGRIPSREGMVAALESFDKFDLGGYVVSYRRGMRSGSRFVELSIVSGAGKIRQ
jgi:ABC-type branched-subunit amino acid transport system substrate-binding protein